MTEPVVTVDPSTGTGAQVANVSEIVTGAPVTTPVSAAPVLEFDARSESDIKLLPQKVQDYIYSLRDENAKRRLEKKEAEALATQYKIKADEYEQKDLVEQGNYKKLAEVADTRRVETEKKARVRIARETVRALAVSNGLIDPDLADLIPLDSVSVDDDFRVTGAAVAVEAYKTSKPVLFQLGKVVTAIPAVSAIPVVPVVAPIAAAIPSATTEVTVPDMRDKKKSHAEVKAEFEKMKAGLPR